MALPAGIDPNQLPAFNTTPANDDRPKPGAIVGGLGAGFHELVGLGGSALQGIGTLGGLPGVADYGKSVAANQAVTAERVGRPDLEIAPWKPGGASVAPWLTYQAAKLIPTLVGYGAATLAAPEATIPAGLIRLGATLPEFLGGAGLEAGASFAARKAALATGTNLGKFVVGGGAFGGVTGFGQAIQSADQKPGGVTASDAVQAAAESPLYAAAGLVEPGFLRGALRGAEGKLATRVIARAFAGGAVGAVQAGTLTALDQTFRPDLSPSDKMTNIVDAAVTGSAVGGVFGGATGIRALKRADPSAVTDDVLRQTIDEVISPTLGLPAPPAFTDAMGRTAMGSGGDATLRATPADAGRPAAAEGSQAAPTLFGPEAVSDRAAVPGSTIVVGRRGESGRFTNEATGVEHPPVVPEDTSRSFRNFTDEELSSASNALANRQEAGGLTKDQQLIAKKVGEELTFRQQGRNDALTADAVQPATEAVDRSASRRGTVEQDSAGPASTPIQIRIDELTQGLRLPATLKEKLASARSENDIQNIVHDEVIIEGKGGKMRDALAQRVGVLDDEGRPAPLADEVSARKTAPGEQASTPAADAMFLERWKQDVQTSGQKDPAVRALKPVSEADAQSQIYRALGDQGVKSDADGLERLAQKYGVLDENKQLTPLAVEIAKKDPITTQDAVKAAIGQGFKGADASMFDRGVRSYVGEGEQITNFNSTRSGEAFQAGTKWAEETNSVPKGALKKYESSAYTGEITDEQRQLGTKVEVKRAIVPPEAREKQLVNEAIDNAGLTPAKNEGDIAALKRMVRRGDISSAMDGLRRVQRGERLFEEPARQPQEPFRGEVVTRGAPKTQAGPELVPTKAATRAQAERAIRNYEIGKETDAAATRADRRSYILQVLQDLNAKRVQEAEVPELNVDRNGILKANLGDQQRTTASVAEASQIITHAVENPTDVRGVLKSIADLGGDLGDMAKKIDAIAPDGITFKVMSPQEMNAIERQLNIESGHPNAEVTGKLWGLYESGTKPGEGRILLHVGMPHPAIALHEIVHAITGLHIASKSDIGRQMISAFNRFKGELRKQGDYAGVDADEFMSEFISRKAVRDFVKSQGDGKGSIFQRVWDAVRKALDMPPRDHVEKLFDLVEAAGRKPLDAYGRPIQAKMLGNSPITMMSKTQDTVGSIVDAVDKRVDAEGIKGVLRRGQLYATSIHHITEHYAPWFDFKREDGTTVNGVKQREMVTDFKEAVQQRHAQLITDVMDRAYRLAHEDKKAFETTNRLMDLTQFGIHPARGWEQQIKEVRDNPALKSVVEEANNMYRSLQTKGHVDIYNDLRKFNDVMMLAKTAMSLHDHVSTDRVAGGRIAEFADSPMRRFMDEQAREGYGLQESHDFWNRELDNQTAAIRAFSDANELHPPKDLSATDKRKMSASIDTLRGQLSGVNDVRERLDAFPNFHLGRDGEYFVDMKLRTGKDGRVDPADMAAAADHLQQFGRVISPHSGADHIYFRVDNTVAQANLLKAAEALQKSGVVRGDVHDETRGVTDHAIISGRRSDDRVQARLADQWSNRLVQEVAANEHITADDKKFLIAAIRSQALDLTPDNSLSKVMAHRDNVPGFDPDMLRSFNSRAKVSVDALAGMAAARDVTDSYANMRSAVQAARTAPTARMSIAQRNGMTEVVDELSKRDKDLASAPRSTKALDQLQAVSGAFFLSANLAYPAVNLIQVPMIALPELGSRYGYTKTARAMASATPEALKIIRAIAKSGLKISASRAADAVLTLKALKDAGITGHKAEFLMQVANRGGVDIGGASRELARNSKATRGSKVDQGLRIASALGYYSETLSRLVVGLAEYRLHPSDMPIDKMADTTVRTLKESMWDYSSPNTSRMLSRNGFLGKLTPLATQFMKYTAMLNEKLYREVHAAVGGDKEAQRFLAGHLAMTTVFAGTLGLPFASVFASTYDRLNDWLDAGDQPSDIQASYRNFLADMLGKNAAEVIARGTPRAAGIDLSTRVGEQDILPFSKFIADRRGFKDSLKDLESRAWGAPSSMMLNMATGGQRVAQGDLEGGFRQMLPLGLSSMVKAYQMTDQGFTDSKGNVLPMTPSTRDILAQAVGFNPAQNAEYNEARSDQMQRQGLLARQSAAMRSKIVDAITAGDRDQARELIKQAVVFDRANPAFGVLRGVEGSIKRRQQAQAVSQQFRVPMGVSPKDMAAPALTNYANVEFQSQ